MIWHRVEDFAWWHWPSKIMDFRFLDSRYSQHTGDGHWLCTTCIFLWELVDIPVDDMHHNLWTFPKQLWMLEPNEHLMLVSWPYHKFKRKFMTRVRHVKTQSHVVGLGIIFFDSFWPTESDAVSEIPLSVMTRVRHVKTQSHVVDRRIIFSTLFEPLNPMEPLEFLILFILTLFDHHESRLNTWSINFKIDKNLDRPGP